MSKTSETGHAKNVANFEELVTYAQSYNGEYNPSRESIKVETLQNLLANGKQRMADYNIALSPYKIAAAERETAFEPLSKFTTRLVNSLKATDTSAQMDNIVQSIARKIKGERVAPKKEVVAVQQGETTDVGEKEISTAQTSYDNRLENFSKLFVQLQNIPQFQPNEVELQPQTIKAFYDNMVEKNNAARRTAVALSNARIARNKVLYEPITGMIDIAFDTKVYIKSLYGAISPQYKQVGGIQFKSNK
jgi:hypothetical protein